MDHALKQAGKKRETAATLKRIASTVSLVLDRQKLLAHAAELERDAEMLEAEARKQA